MTDTTTASTLDAAQVASLDAYKAENAKHGWTGRAFSFSPGFLNLNSDGGASIGCMDTEAEWESDDETGKMAVFFNMPPEEVLALRDYLNAAFPTALQQQLDEARAERDEHLRLKNKLVLVSYRAMDAVAAIREWCDAQTYQNDTITVALLRDMLPDEAVAPELPDYSEWNDEANRERRLRIAAELALSARDAAWKPIETYDREKGEIAVLLDWFTYRTDPAKKPWPVRYVGSWSTDHEAWFDDDGMDLDIDPTHWLPLPSVDAPQRQCAPVIAALDNDKEQRK